jgi:predicted ATP-dependent protease
MMIRSGSVLQANGGYLVMNALDVLRNPFSWDALKRIIKKNEVKIEDVAELYGFTTGGIKPEPIPVLLKIIMLESLALLPPLLLRRGLPRYLQGQVRFRHPDRELPRREDALRELHR